MDINFYHVFIAVGLMLIVVGFFSAVWVAAKHIEKKHEETKEMQDAILILRMEVRKLDKSVDTLKGKVND